MAGGEAYFNKLFGREIVMASFDPDCECVTCRAERLKAKYDWATPDAKSDKQFLMWIWARLSQVFGEPEHLDYMRRLDDIIEKMPGNARLDIVDDGKFDIYRKGKLVHSDI